MNSTTYSLQISLTGWQKMRSPPLCFVSQINIQTSVVQLSLEPCHSLCTAATAAFLNPLTVHGCDTEVAKIAEVWRAYENNLRAWKLFTASLSVLFMQRDDGEDVFVGPRCVSVRVYLRYIAHMCQMLLRLWATRFPQNQQNCNFKYKF